MGLDLVQVWFVADFAEISRPLDQGAERKSFESFDCAIIRFENYALGYL